VCKKITRNVTITKKLIQQKWRYCFNSSGQLFYLQTAYNIDSTYFEEDYYINNQRLIYSEEKEIYFIPSVSGKEEAGHWIEYCYFITGKLVHERSAGHGKSEMDNWHPETEVPQRFVKRHLQLVQHLHK